MIKVYTDGGCWPNPGGIGGWGAVILLNGEHIELSGAEENTTNNRMEITAAVEALRYLQTRQVRSSVTIVSDSAYLVNGANIWVHSWVKYGWKRKHTKNGKVKFANIKNVELWQDLVRISSSSQDKVTFAWVKGHNGDDMNERADQLAGDAAKAHGADTDFFSQPHPKQAG